MKFRLPVYLDHNATTPMDPRVLEEMLPFFLDKFGNAASRSHAYGWEAEEAVDIARDEVASLIGARSTEIIFTSGATEAVNLAVKGLFETRGKSSHIITVQTEHKAVLDTCHYVERNGGTITYLPVDPNGLISLIDLENAITPNTILISVMYANNETGVIQPVREISSIAKKHGIFFFTDATQAVGKIPINVSQDGIDMMAFSAHKFYGPKGIGALFVRKNILLTAQIDGGGHERNRRSGTLNVPGIAGLGKACALAERNMNQEMQRLQRLRNAFESQLETLGETVVNAKAVSRLPHCSSISFMQIDGPRFILEAASKVAFSQSSACTSVTLQPSYVLKAMGLADEVILNSFRFSLGRYTTDMETEFAAGIISEIVKKQRNEGNY
jgi:cysteine desulfurase